MDLLKLVDSCSEVDRDAERKPVQILTEDGDVFDVVAVEYDPEADVTYLKVELAGE
jgi:hypothetical protein